MLHRQSVRNVLDAIHSTEHTTEEEAHDLVMRLLLDEDEEVLIPDRGDEATIIGIDGHMVLRASDTGLLEVAAIVNDKQDGVPFHLPRQQVRFLHAWLGRQLYP